MKMSEERLKQIRDNYKLRLEGLAPNLDVTVSMGELLAHIDALASEQGWRAVERDMTSTKMNEIGLGTWHQFYERQVAWSEATFGTGYRYEQVLRHMEKEIAEVRANPADLEEWIDLMMLAFDGAWRSGASLGQILEALNKKQDKNKAREWVVPDDPNEPREHKRTPAPDSGTAPDPALALRQEEKES